MTSLQPVLAVTPGEPSGIGPEIVLKFLFENPGVPLLVVADPGLMSERARLLGMDIQVNECTGEQPLDPKRLNVLPVSLHGRSQPGELNPDHAQYVLATLDQAVDLVSSRRADALVTGPVHKGVINDAGISFTGHTEYLSQKAGVDKVVMMLAAPGLRVCLVTTHLPLREVADAVTARAVEETIRITHASLLQQFGISEPRLQVLGLNPHAGEGGHLGHEDADIIAPVLQRLRSEGMNLKGPIPADTAFNPPQLAECDAVVAMYHDQGLPVLKHLGFGRAVNITLGLPYVRTSVDHGTALDLAGTGTADTGSLREAIQYAHSMASRP